MGRKRAGGDQIRQLAGRAGWNIADQLVSSATNVMLSILVARSLSADGFGAFAVAFTVYTFLIGAVRALIAQPLVVRYTSQESNEFRVAARSATGATTAFGLVSGGVTVATGFLLGDAVGSSLIAIGILLPGLLLQDMWRTVFVAEGRPAAAFWNDVAWGVVQFAAVWAIIAFGRESAPSLVFGWGGAALIAALIGVYQFGASPRIRSSAGWMRRQRDLLGYYLAGFLSIMGASQLTILLIGGFGSPAAVGALRAAAIVLGPLNILGYSLSAFALPELARRQLGGSTAVKAALALSGIMVLADVVWGIVLLAMPDVLGAALLGDSWSNAQAVLPASLIGLVAIGVGFGASVLMVARGWAKQTFWISAIFAPSSLVCGLLGLHLWGAPGAALGLSLAQVFVVPVVWWQVVRLLRVESRADADIGRASDRHKVANDSGK